MLLLQHRAVASATYSPRRLLSHTHGGGMHNEQMPISSSEVVLVLDSLDLAEQDKVHCSVCPDHMCVKHAAVCRGVTPWHLVVTVLKPI